MYSTYFSHKNKDRVSYFLFFLSLYIGNAENFWISNDVSTLLRRIFVRLQRNRLRRSSIHRYRKLDSFQTYVILCAISISVFVVITIHDRRRQKYNIVYQYLTSNWHRVIYCAWQLQLVQKMHFASLQKRNKKMIFFSFSLRVLQ